ncbi:MAG: molybdenum cofactor guanylyltransferase [Caulobacter sp.]|nr:molybdenum cofactor guanylyltransferase [Caulobacter sp.]
MSESVVAVILAGGEGRRMGGGKPGRRFGDATLLDRAARLARGYCDTVAIAVREPRQVRARPALPRIIDQPEIEGPLAGLAAALAYARRAGARWVLTLPCDMPHMPPDLRRRLEAAASASGDNRVIMAASGGRAHPVCALWPTDGGGALEHYAASGRRSLKGFAAELGVTLVEWRCASGDPFANANTPEELDALQPWRAARVA